MTTTEAARELGVSTARIRELIALGKLTARLEPFGPGTRWLVDAGSVAKRKAAKRKGALSKGGRPKGD